MKLLKVSPLTDPFSNWHSNTPLSDMAQIAETYCPLATSF